jgi:DUF1680 family protein
MLPTWMYSKGDDGLYVNLFVGSTVKVEKVAGTDVEMVQETDYPWSGKVKMTVNPAQSKAFALRVRAPDRSVSAIYSDAPEVNGILSLAVNGQAIKPVIENGYAVIQREWKAGDTVEMEMPLKPYRLKAVDAVAADRGRVAIKLGPVVYNVESVDGSIDGVLAEGSPLEAKWRPELLGGVMTVEGKYADGSPLVAVPNYVRENRGGRSVVWIRDQ